MQLSLIHGNLGFPFDKHIHMAAFTWSYTSFQNRIQFQEIEKIEVVISGNAKNSLMICLTIQEFRKVHMHS